ncbi:MAG: RidA family protein [Oscillospiraceae bacterium]|nr:RidA family protein [Oscillospiraceae bacterium]
MSIQRFEENQRLSMACAKDDLLFLSGMVGDPDIQDFDAQVESLLQWIDELLERYGSDREHMVSVRIYLRDVTKFSAFNRHYESWLAGNHKPARTCVGAQLADERWLAEMEVVAELL